MRRIGTLLYGIACYAIFFATFLYLVGFMADLAVPKSIDSGAAGPLGRALVVNTLLLVLFPCSTASWPALASRPGGRVRCPRSRLSPLR